MFRGLVILLSLFYSVNSYAVLFDREGRVVENISESNLETIPYNDISNRIYGAVGGEISESGCTAWLIENGGGSTAPAYAVFAGHCQYYKSEGVEDFHASNKFLIPKDMVHVSLTEEDLAKGATTGIWKGHELSDFTYFDLRFFSDVYSESSSSGSSDSETIENLRFQPLPKQIAYWTMNGIDIIIYELIETKVELEKANLHPLKIAELKPQIGDPLEIVTAFYSSRDKDIRYLKTATCEKGAEVVVSELDYRFEDVFRHKCSASSGSSGAPILNENHEVVGMHFTSVKQESGLADCQLSRPCEIGVDGSAHVEPDQNYAVNLVGLSNCFNDSGYFVRDLPDCPLP